MIHYVGIDPGLTGAIACLADRGDSIDYSRSWVRKAPTREVTLHTRSRAPQRRTTHDEARLVMLIDTMRRDAEDAQAGLVVTIERVWARPAARNDSAQGHGTQGAFALAYGYGLWIGALMQAGIEPHQVAPVTWQRALELGRGEGKLAIGQAVVSRHPELRPSIYGPRGGLMDGPADAIGIADYARRQGWRSLTSSGSTRSRSSEAADAGSPTATPGTAGR